MPRALTRIALVVGPAVIIVCLGATALLPLGWWRPATALPLAVLAVLAAVRVSRGVTLDGPGPGAEPRSATRVSDRALTWAMLLVITAITVANAALHGEHVVLRRDPGAYALYTQWIAVHGGLPVDAHLAAFGGPAAFAVPGFTLDAPAFYQVLSGTAGAGGAQIVPQFLLGVPAVQSYGWWFGDLFGHPWTGVFVMPAIAMAAALLAFGVLARRWLGAGWALLAVTALGCALPNLLVGRSTYSEAVALAVLLSAVVWLVAMTRAPVPGTSATGQVQLRAAVVAGAVLGLAGLIRIDAIREVALLVVACVPLAILRIRGVIALAFTATAGAALALGAAAWLSGPYLRVNAESLRPLLFGTAAVIVAAVVVVPLGRRLLARGAGLPTAWTPRLGGALGVLVLLAGVGLVSRPLWLVDRSDPTSPTALFVAALQRGEGLPIDPGRSYAEHSLSWVAWSLGWPVVVAGWVAFAALARSLPDQLRPGRPLPGWLIPAAVGFASTVLVLVRPGITPDHLWADRRLVPVVLPLFVMAAVAAVAVLSRWLGSRIDRSAPRSALGGLPATGLPGNSVLVNGLLVLVVLAPVVVASAPLAGLRTERGEVAAVQGVCDRLPQNAVVVAVDGTSDGHVERSGNEWLQVIRGICGRPSAGLRTPLAALPGAVRQLNGLVRAQGGELVMLTAQENAAAAQRVLASAAPEVAGGPVEQAASLVTVEQRKLLTRRPPSGARLVIEVWLQRIG